MAKNLTFIVSGGRTGTKFLGDLISQAIDDCYSEHEPDIVHGFDAQSLSNIRRFGIWHSVIGRLIGQSGVRVLGARYLLGKDSLQDTARKLRSQRAKYHATVQQSLLIESYYAWWMVAPKLQSVFPGSKAIGIVRDPRTWIASWLSRSSSRASGHWTHKLPPGPITAQTMGDTHWQASWDELSDIAKLAWQWQLVNRTLLQAKDEAGLTIFRFEDIFDAKSETLQKLLSVASDFDGSSYAIRNIDHLIEFKRNSSSAKDGEWRDWSLADRNLINAICGDVMEQLGYDPV